MRKSALITVALFLLAVTPLPFAQADSNFNMNFIVTDDEFQDSLIMSADKIQQFLGSQPGILAAYIDPATGKSAAQIIFEAAQTNHISARVILTTIQKESSMITRTDFGAKGQQYYLDWVAFYGWCDSCSTGSNQGFANQVSAMSSAFRRYVDSIHLVPSGQTIPRGYTISGFGPNIAKQVVDCQSYNPCVNPVTYTVTPANDATSALFTYTPHVSGNNSFWNIWNEFSFNFSRLYPDGSLLRAQNGQNIYLVQNGLLRRFASMSAFLSRYNLNTVVTVPADHLTLYNRGRDINFANYSLLASPRGGVYLLVDDVKRPIKNRAAFQQAGFRKEEVLKVTWDDLNQYPDGDTITTDNIYPSGQLLQNRKTGGVYFVKDGLRHAIFSKEIFRSQFGLRKAIPTLATLITKYPDGGPVGFKDGELVVSKKGGPVYVISDGYRLPIAGPTAFSAYHFSYANVIKTSDDALSIHPIGPTLSVDSNIQSASQ
ncbi:MAG: hypothetical protein HY092_00300 [Candidatus Kerfeldbacteria bacterium]|nr:hypothetical protein [Candidatus Kerfeldbacteria bacterium]